MVALDDIPLGAEVKDRVSGAQGIVIERAAHISGCDRVVVREVDDTPMKGDKAHLFPTQVEVIEEDTEFTEERDNAIIECDHIELGYEVRDHVTGFTGVAIAINVGMMKTPDVLVSTDDGGETNVEWFDDVRLEQLGDEPIWQFEDSGREPTESNTGAAGSSSPDREFSP